jgi:hypothetical protein
LSIVCIPVDGLDLLHLHPWSMARFLHPLQLQLQQLIDSKVRIDGELPPLTNELLLPSPSAGLRSLL